MEVPVAAPPSERRSAHTRQVTSGQSGTLGSDCLEWDRRASATSGFEAVFIVERGSGRGNRRLPKNFDGAALDQGDAFRG